MTRRFKYVQAWVEKDGRERVRFRRKGYPMIELPGPVGSENFVFALKEASLGRPISSRAVKARTAELPENCGVYLLLLNGKIVYVGASLDMKLRVDNHRSNGRPFDKAFFIRTKPFERYWLEKLLIAAVKPKQNRAERLLSPLKNHPAFGRQAPEKK
jgi:predicted GIY-YIG superfamily endonuclease